LCQAAKVRNHVSAVSGSTWLKQSDNKKVCSFISQNTFSTASISMRFVSKIETVSLQGCFEPVCTIDEKPGVVNVMFLAELSEKDFR
jgi:hypothetical protein